MKITRLITPYLAIFLLLLMAGCATVPMSSPAADAAAKQFKPVPDKSVLYVYRDESMGAAVRMDVKIDGETCGQTAADTYFRFVLPPGNHKITSVAENTDSVDIDMKPGQLYYVWQEVKMGVLYARSKLHVIGANKGQTDIRSCKLALPTPKKAPPAVATAHARQ